MTVHLFNGPVSPYNSLGWADPVKITTSGGALILKIGVLQYLHYLQQNSQYQF